MSDSLAFVTRNYYTAQANTHRKKTHKQQCDCNKFGLCWKLILLNFNDSKQNVIVFEFVCDDTLYLHQ